jgi:hypothetical protein
MAQAIPNRRGQLAATTLLTAYDNLKVTLLSFFVHLTVIVHSKPLG